MSLDSGKLGQKLICDYELRLKENKEFELRRLFPMFRMS